MTTATRDKYQVGDKVRISISEPRWSGWAVKSLNGQTGVVEKIKHEKGHDWIGLGPYLVQLDKPYPHWDGREVEGSWWMKEDELSARKDGEE